MKKILLNLASVVVAILIIVVSMPVCFATDYSGTGENGYTWQFDGATGTMTVKGTGEMEDSFYMNWNGEDNRLLDFEIDLSPMIRKLIISEGITSIGHRAFAGLTEMTSVDIPNTVTKIEPIAFADAWKLESITIPEGVTILGGTCFKACKGIKTITIPDTVTEIGRDAFRGCVALESVVISNNVEIIPEDCFLGCKNLVDVQFGSSVKIIEAKAFKECSSLRQVVLPESVERIEFDEAFSYCHNLEKIYIPSSITYISGQTFLSQYTTGNIKDIYFGGSKEAWDALNPEDISDIQNATIHYNSKPSDMNPVPENSNSDNGEDNIGNMNSEPNSSNTGADDSDKGGAGPVIGAVAGVAAVGAGVTYIFIKKRK